MKQGQKTSDGKNIITQINDNTKVIFRMDVGDNAHSMVEYGYPDPTNHINIEIQVKGTNGKYKTEWNFHIMLDSAGEVAETFSTGVWKK